ncbi:Uncharacterised protein at_DN0590 [Pycnogonum litorale]
MEVDTGSPVSLINKQMLLKHWCNYVKPLKHTNIKLKTYSGESLKMLGCLSVSISVHGTPKNALLHVIDGYDRPNLLGRDWLEILELDWSEVKHINKIDMSQSEFSMETIRQKFPQIFSGIGLLKNKTISLHINDNVAPKHQQHRRIPYHIRQDVEKEISRFLELDVIERVGGTPTPWVSPIVVVPKKSNQIRICVDMREANKAIERERHVMPTLDDLKNALNGVLPDFPLLTNCCYLKKADSLPPFQHMLGFSDTNS